MAIKLGDAIVYLKGDRSQLTKDLDAGKQQTSTWTTTVGTMAGQLMGTVITGGANLAMGAVSNLGQSIVGAVQDAMAIEGVSKTFDKLTESVGGNAAVALEQLRESTRGMVADADLMMAGNKFLAMGLADTTEGAAELAEIATQLGMAMGEDATASMENFALMMANQSIPRLDSFGISSGKVRERINELMAETEGLTREQAFNQAVMEQARVTMEKVGEQGDTASGSMARIRTVIENLKLEVGTYFLPVIEKLLGFVGDKLPIAIDWLRGKWEELQALWQVFQGIYNQYIKPPLEALQEAFGRLMEALGLNKENMEGMGDTFGKVIAKIVELEFEIWLNTIIALIEGLTAAINVVVDVIDLFKQGWEAIKNIKLPDWLTPGSITPFESGIRGITEAMTELSTLGVPQLQAAFAGVGNQSQITNHNYYLTAQYRQMQSESSLADDVRALSILTGGR